MNTKQEILEVVREMPGLTTSDVIDLMPHVPRGTVASSLNSLCAQGKVLRATKPREGKYGRANVAIYTINPTPKPPIKQRKITTPTPTALEAQLSEARAKVAELTLWKENAIHRYPDLDVDPVVLEARKIVAAELDAMSDHALAEQVRSGKKDNILPMRVTVAALNKVC